MFLQIAAAPEYEVNEYGLVRRCDNCRALTPFKRGKYDAVKLNGVNYSVHRLVLMTFRPIPNCEAMDVDHIDFNPTNNRLENLRWADHRENAKRQQRRVNKNARKDTGEQPIRRQRRKAEPPAQESSDEALAAVGEDAE